jgi:hypothetical protein
VVVANSYRCYPAVAAYRLCLGVLRCYHRVRDTGSWTKKFQSDPYVDLFGKYSWQNYRLGCVSAGWKNQLVVDPTRLHYWWVCYRSQLTISVSWLASERLVYSKEFNSGCRTCLDTLSAMRSCDSASDRWSNCDQPPTHIGAIFLEDS